MFMTAITSLFYGIHFLPLFLLLSDYNIQGSLWRVAPYFWHPLRLTAHGSRLTAQGTNSSTTLLLLHLNFGTRPPGP